MVKVNIINSKDNFFRLDCKSVPEAKALLHKVDKIPVVSIEDEKGGRIFRVKSGKWEVSTIPSFCQEQSKKLLKNFQKSRYAKMR